MHSTFKKLSVLALTVLMAASLSSCGRRGALEAPSSQIESEQPAENATDKPAEKPDRRFILDGLI